MKNHTSTASKNAVCLLGLPDNCEVSVEGYSENGQLAYSWDGNSDFHNQLDGHISKSYLPIVWHNTLPLKLKKPDMLVNSINDADIASKSLAMAKKIAADITAKWPEVKFFNHPEKIANTTRERIYQLYNNIVGIYVPKTVRVTPVGVANAMELAEEHIGFPFLIRPAGAHQSQGLQLIQTKADAKLLERYSFNKKDFYLTEFVDYKNTDGIYQKARLVIIGGKILPRHYMTGQTWLVHGNLHEEFMAENESAKSAEQNFVNNYKNIIGQQQLDALMQIYNSSGLDYLGFDFAIRSDGSLLIFEINAAQNSFLKLDFEIFPYMKKVREDVVAAFNNCIKEKLS